MSLLRVLLPLAIFSTQLNAIVIYDNFESSFGPAGYVLIDSPTFYSFQVYTAPIGLPFAGQKVAELWTKQDFVYPGNPNSQVSDRRELFFYENNPNLPTLDQALKRQQILDLIRVRTRRPSILPVDDENYQWRGTPAVGSGVRGSLDLNNLTEASPAWASFVNSPEDAFPFIPFIVNHAGDGDTLSIYGNDGLLWNSSLSGLELGVLYFAVLPAYTAKTMSFTSIWLNSTGEVNASVSIASGWEFAPEDYAPNSVPDDGATLALILIALVPVAMFRRRSVS